MVTVRTALDASAPHENEVSEEPDGGHDFDSYVRLHSARLLDFSSLIVQSLQRAAEEATRTVET